MDKLYDDVMMDHIKNARNYRDLKSPSKYAEGVNPLCGDRFSVFVDLHEDHIKDVSFTCECCGISMASASMMTDLLKGKSQEEARDAILAFKDFISGRDTQFPYGEDIKAVLGVVNKFPSRINCASLGWATLEAALNDESEVVINKD